MSHGKVVPVDDLVAALWGEESPTSARNSLQSHVSRLRDALRPAGASIEAGPVGYRLAVPDAAVDAVRFEQLLEAARREPGRRRPLGSSTRPWPGGTVPPDAEFADDFARPEAVRLEELRVTAREDRAEALLTAGRQLQAVAALEALAAEHPLRSARRRCSCARVPGRPPRRGAVGLRAYRERLDDGFGLEPSEAMRAVQQAVLRQALDAEFAWHLRRRRHVPLRGVPSACRLRARRSSAATKNSRPSPRSWPGHASSACSARAAPGKHGWPLEVAQHHGDTFSGGVEWGGSGGGTGRGREAYAVADALGIQDLGQGPVEDGLITALYDRRLVVVDNCEHVLDATRPPRRDAGRRLPDVAVLATSRSGSASTASMWWRSSRWHPPPTSTRLQSASSSIGWPALGRRQPSRRTDLDRIAALCACLDGLPLALELAAARASTLGIEVVSDRASGGLLDLLDRGRRTADERHRSLRAVVDWSYRLLDEPEQRLFERLSICRRFSLERAEVVCGDPAVPARQIGRLWPNSSRSRWWW